jgi:uncharacterized glyoxalase superfamily protein PhnB
MRITSSSIALTVADPAASSSFLQRHFGYRELVAADGFASVAREGGVGIALMRTGLSNLPEEQRGRHATGIIVAFEVADLDAELERLRNEGAPFAMDLHCDPWGERAFQVVDPNGIIYQCLDWNGPVDPAYAQASAAAQDR